MAKNDTTQFQKHWKKSSWNPTLHLKNPIKKPKQFEALLASASGKCAPLKIYLLGKRLLTLKAISKLPA